MRVEDRWSVRVYHRLPIFWSCLDFFEETPREFFPVESFRILDCDDCLLRNTGWNSSKSTAHSFGLVWADVFIIVGAIFSVSFFITSQIPAAKHLILPLKQNMSRKNLPDECQPLSLVHHQLGIPSSAQPNCHSRARFLWQCPTMDSYCVFCGGPISKNAKHWTSVYKATSAIWSHLSTCDQATRC